MLNETFSVIFKHRVKVSIFRMSFTPCPSPSRHPSYSTKTQDEINHQALRENLQHYYMSQQKLRQKQKEVERLEKKKVERTTSASSTSSGTATGNKTATTIGNVQLYFGL